MYDILQNVVYSVLISNNQHRRCLWVDNNGREFPRHFIVGTTKSF